ncbi:alpha/beta hydrolase [Aquisediminimonas profunda]|uniref:alpha/beta hydrolase n=1 Tax=Aquisediminimonas profunda TaxID=1550733 RepID=UPI001C629029|nr:alpha/beta hydrolase [Aquisediminimonas profunda]
MKTLFFCLIAVAVALLLFTRIVEPPNQLDYLDRFWPGQNNAEKLASDITFDEASAQKLNIWGVNAPNAHRKRPVLVFFYGGGWANGDRDHYGFAARAYANRGFIVVLPDYRKVPHVHFPIFNQDAAAAVRWVHDNISRYGGDSDRIVLAGHSAGAYIAMMLTLDRSYLMSAGVKPSIIRGTVGLSGPYDFYPYDSRRSINAMNRWPRPLETQPIAFARKDAPPIMIITGTSDDTVKPRNAILLSRKLHELGAPVKFRAYNDLNHEDIVMALSKPFRSKAPVLQDSADFLMKVTEQH